MGRLSAVCIQHYHERCTLLGSSGCCHRSRPRRPQPACRSRSNSIWRVSRRVRPLHPQRSHHGAQPRHRSPARAPCRRHSARHLAEMRAGFSLVSAKRLRRLGGVRFFFFNFCFSNLFRLLHRICNMQLLLHALTSCPQLHGLQRSPKQDL